jgi:hypothetical protein
MAPRARPSGPRSRSSRSRPLRSRSPSHACRRTRSRCTASFFFVDPHSHLAQDASAEATASPLSTLLFAFLDPLVRAAATHVQLDADADLPPLRAADRTTVLAATMKRTAYDSMDVHVPVTLLRGLMSMFRWSIAAQAGVLVLEVCSRPVP